MHIPHLVRKFGLPAAALPIALLVLACGGSESAGWTYAPLGPTAAANASPSAAASPAGSPGESPAGSPGGSPAGSPGASGGTGGAVDIATTQADPLGFEPAEPEMPAAAEVTVNYLNDSNLPHNIVFFAGTDSSSERLGETEQVTGPGALESTTFTAPSEPGDYYFWCDVHATTMDGIYHVR